MSPQKYLFILVVSILATSRVHAQFAIFWTPEGFGDGNTRIETSREKMPTGTTIKIQVVKVGTSGGLFISDSDTRTPHVMEEYLRVLAKWDPIAGSVCSYTMKRPAYISMYTGGQNFYQRCTPGYRDQANGYDVIHYDSGWVFHVKTYGPDF